jgi:hypothetical protein
MCYDILMAYRDRFSRLPLFVTCESHTLSAATGGPGWNLDGVLVKQCVRQAGIQLLRIKALLVMAVFAERLKQPDSGP